MTYINLQQVKHNRYQPTCTTDKAWCVNLQQEKHERYQPTTDKAWYTRYGSQTGNPQNRDHTDMLPIKQGSHRVRQTCEMQTCKMKNVTNTNSWHANVR